MKTLKGYIFSREFNNGIVPQKIQNTILREYCLKKNYSFVLSNVEYSMQNCFYVLDRIVRNSRKYDGVLAYSIFQMPENDDKRFQVYKKIINKKKELHFALEDIILSKKCLDNLNFIEQTLSIKKNINKSNFSISVLKNYI